MFLLYQNYIFKPTFVKLSYFNETVSKIDKDIDLVRIRKDSLQNFKKSKI